MKLYTDPRALSSTKVLWLLHHENIPFELHSIDLAKGESHSPLYASMNPNNRVPTLQDGELVLWESSAILLYLAEKQKSALLPGDVRARAELNRWLFWHTAHWGPALGTLTFQRIAPHFFPGFETDQKAVAEAEKQFQLLAPILENQLAERDYVLGAFGLADIALAAHASERRQAGIDFSPYANISAWLSRLEEQPAWQRATRSRVHV